MVPHAQLEIHIPNVLHNYRYFRSKLRPEITVVVKYVWDMVPPAQLEIHIMPVQIISQWLQLRRV